MRRIVLDCNVFVSALLSPRGAPAQILEQWTDGDFDLVVSPLLLAELEKVLSRPKFRTSIDKIQVDALLTGLVEDAVLVDDPPPQVGLTLDPGDDYLLALAQKVNAQCIVSGDTHLTQLADVNPPVLMPREFLEGERDPAPAPV
ncbi:MAG: putative toxin-antitoxin system toxin component, PIN family [Solirubrobacteraceae bacterium]